MPHQSPSDDMLITLDIGAQIASANINGGQAYDMSGWDGIMFVFNVGTMANGATFDARIVSSANANMAGNTNITNAAITQLTNASNVNAVIIDVWRPTNRYVRSATMPATANSTFASFAIQYRRTGTKPVTAPTTTVQTVKVAQN